MSEQYSHLIQDIGTININRVFLALPNSINIIKDIIVCNLDTEVRKFSIALVKDSEVLSNKHYIFYETKIDPKETISLTGMWCLDPGSEVKFYADKNDVVSINAFGIKVSLS